MLRIEMLYFGHDTWIIMLRDTTSNLMKLGAFFTKQPEKPGGETRLPAGGGGLSNDRFCDYVDQTLIGFLN